MGVTVMPIIGLSGPQYSCLCAVFCVYVFSHKLITEILAESERERVQYTNSETSNYLSSGHKRLLPQKPSRLVAQHLNHIQLGSRLK
jgi:hypothetical protein